MKNKTYLELANTAIQNEKENQRTAAALKKHMNKQAVIHDNT